MSQEELPFDNMPCPSDKYSEPVEKEDEDTSTGITYPYSPSDIRITTNPMNLGDLMEMIEAGWINFETKYQRYQNLWSKKDQSRFIESILLGLRLPAFYFEEVNRRNWNIIDGLQRCCAIRNFCIDKSFQLSDMEFLGQFNGRGYQDFSFEIRRDFRMLPITVNILAADTPTQVKYILFKRLNTGGVTLKPQEIRTAMFQSIAGILKTMAECPEFLRVTENKIPTDRQEDRDFVSRFIAFYLLGYQEYTEKMDIDSFLNAGMERLEDLYKKNNATEQNLLEAFKRSLDIAWNIFGNDAFRKRLNANDNSRRPINKAYFEVLTTTFAKLNNQDEKLLTGPCQELFKENLIILMNRKQFIAAISSGTGRVERVRARHEGVAEAIEMALQGKKMG